MQVIGLIKIALILCGPKINDAAQKYRDINGSPCEKTFIFGFHKSFV